MKTRVAAAFAVSAVGVMLAPAGAAAATFLANDTTDRTGGCSASGRCSLRQALTAANASPGLDTVLVDGGTHSLTRGQISISDSVNILGEGAAPPGSAGAARALGAAPSPVTVDANDTSRIFGLTNGAISVTISGLTLRGGRDSIGAAILSTSAQLVLDNVTVRNNRAVGPNASGFGAIALEATGSERLTVRNSSFISNTAGGGGSSGQGGAILATPTEDNNSLTISIERSEFIDNSAGGGGGSGVGGAIRSGASGSGNVERVSIVDSAFSGNWAGGGSHNADGGGGAIGASVVGGGGNYYSLSIARSTFAANHAGSGGAIGIGGAVYLTTDGPNALHLDLVNSTIAANWAGGGGGDGTGGGLGLFKGFAADQRITNATISGNVAFGSGLGGGIQGADSVQLRNTILSGNLGAFGPNCDGPAASAGHNLESAGSCKLTAAGDHSNVDPLLALLGDNGGPTETQALLPGSPAIDAGDPAACPATDQRGSPRPERPDGRCDIGAFETGALADMRARASTPSDTYGQGDTIVYRLRADNGGPDNATGVRLVTSIAAGVKIKSARPSQGQCSVARSLTCSFGSLRRGESATVEVAASTTNMGSVRTTTSVTADQIDPDPSNNSIVRSAGVLLGLSQLSIKPTRIKATRARAGGSTAYISKRRATVTYRLYRKAIVRFTIARISGQKVRRLRGVLRHRGRRGINRRAFRPRLRGRNLKPGRYRLTARARARGAGSSPPRSVDFRIVR